jgi:hypothetical protein
MINIAVLAAFATSEEARRQYRRSQYPSVAPASVLPDFGTGQLGALNSVGCKGSTCAIVCKTANTTGAAPATVPLRLTFVGPTTVQLWMQLDGNFSDIGAAADIIVGKPQPMTVMAADKGAFYALSAAGSTVVVRLQKEPLQLSIVRDGQLALQEAAPLRWNRTGCWQTLARDAAASFAGLSVEHFFGGGMQNGRFAHRDASVTIAKDFNWADGGHPNSAPWYVSSAGVGVLRNTWAPGTYSFGAPVVTSHNESRFDAYYVLSDSLKGLLAQYVELTGKPFLPPLYGMFLGDSDCYHNSRHGNSTQVAVAVAQLYAEHDMPHGWMLPNDGYGCGYGEGPVDFPSNLTDLTLVVAELHKLGMYTGLWTSTGMPNIKAEVGVAGTRICKTDVGWIGSGYK